MVAVSGGGLGPDPEIFTKAPVLRPSGTAQTSASTRLGVEQPRARDRARRRRDGAVRRDPRQRREPARLRGSQRAAPAARRRTTTPPAAIGPFIRLFDDGFTLDDAAAATITMRIAGTDGFVLEAARRRARSPRSGVRAGRAHGRAAATSTPTASCCCCGTMFRRRGRDAPGKGFTHDDGDLVSIGAPSSARWSTASPRASRRRSGTTSSGVVPRPPGGRVSPVIAVTDTAVGDDGSSARWRRRPAPRIAGRRSSARRSTAPTWCSRTSRRSGRRSRPARGGRGRHPLRRRRRQRRPRGLARRGRARLQRA